VFERPARHSSKSFRQTSSRSGHPRPLRPGDQSFIRRDVLGACTTSWAGRRRSWSASCTAGVRRGRRRPPRESELRAAGSAGNPLAGSNRRQLFVPVGFPRFLVLSDTAVLLYKCSDYYAPKRNGESPGTIGHRLPGRCGPESPAASPGCRIPRLEDAPEAGGDLLLSLRFTEPFPPSSGLIFHDDPAGSPSLP